ncbi:MAG: tetratricopeptide repeat protein, partial [Pseudomonadota bacterium]
RQALGDSSTEPRLIATRRRLGYQFIADTQQASPTPAVSEPLPGAAETAAPNPRRLTWPLLSLVALLLVIAAIWQQQQAAPTPSERLPTLAISDMVNSSEDPALNWLAPALETYLGHALVELGGFRVLAIDEQTDIESIDYLIEGQYLSAGVDGSRLLAQLRQPGSDEIVTSLESNEVDWDVAGLSIGLATAIRDHLGFSAPAQSDAASIRSSLPNQADTQRAFFRGRQAYSGSDLVQALNEVESGLRLQPDSPALIMLKAQVLSGLGDIETARTLSEEALTNTRLWPRRDRLDLEATAAMLDFDFDRAADRLQALTQFYPDPINARRLIHALIQSGRLNAAREGLESLRLNRPEDPHIALLGVELARVERNADERLEKAIEARELAEAANASSLIIAARLAEAEALIRTGQLDNAQTTLQPLIDDRLPITQGDQARAQLMLATIEFQRGNFDQALAQTDQIERSFQTLNHPAGLAETYMLRTSIYDRTGRVEESLEQISAAQAMLETLNDPRRLAQAGVLFGVSLMRAQRMDESEAYLSQAASYFRTVNDRQGEGAALINQATLLARLDRPNDAEPIFQRALEAFEDAGDLRGQAIVLGNLAAIAGRRRDVSRSIELSEESLGLFELIGAKTDIARVSFNLGILYRDRGDLLQAETTIRQASDSFAEQGAHQFALRTKTSLAKLLVHMGRGEEAEAVLVALNDNPVEDVDGRSVIDIVRGDRAYFDGDYDRAYEFYSEASAKAEAVNSDAGRRMARIGLAEVALARSQWVIAEQTALDNYTHAVEIRDRSDQVDALLILARARAEQGRLEQAEQNLAEIDQILTEVPDKLQSLKLGIVRGHMGDNEIQRQHLDWVIQTANEVGYLPIAELAQRRLEVLAN